MYIINAYHHRVCYIYIRMPLYVLFTVLNVMWNTIDHLEWFFFFCLFLAQELYHHYELMKRKIKLYNSKYQPINNFIRSFLNINKYFYNSFTWNRTFACVEWANELTHTDLFTCGQMLCELEMWKNDSYSTVLCLLIESW